MFAFEAAGLVAAAAPVSDDFDVDDEDDDGLADDLAIISARERWFSMAVVFLTTAAPTPIFSVATILAGPKSCMFTDDEDELLLSSMSSSNDNLPETVRKRKR